MTAATSRLRRRGIGAGVAALVGLSGLGLSAAIPAQAVASFDLTRPADTSDRFATAASVATSAFTTSTNVIIANGDNAVDALSASYLAGTTTPILYVTNSSVPAATAAAITKLGATNAWVVGGTTAIPDSVVASLSTTTKTRIAGADRYKTAVAVGVAKANMGTKPTTAFIARGDQFADALAIAPVAAKSGIPILLTETGSLNADTLAALKAWGITSVTIVGGPSAVSADVATSLTAQGITSTRVAGSTRSSTATAIANTAAFGFAKTSVYVVNGFRPVDALPAAVAAAKANAPILLTEDGVLGADSQGYLTANANTLTGGVAVGGTTVLPTSVETAAETAAKATTSNSTLVVTPSAAVSLEATAGQENPNVTTDDRSYTVTGLTDATQYRVTLVNGANITTTGGVSSFAIDRTAVGVTSTNPDGANGQQVSGNYLALAGTTTAKFLSLNGGTPVNNTGVGGVSAAVTNSAVANPVNGSLTFTIDGDAPETVVPVVYLNGGAGLANSAGGVSPRLELDSTGKPVESFGLAGATTYTALEAAAGNQAGASLPITAVDKTANSFNATVSSVARRFDFDSNDSYQIGGNPSTFAAFSAALSAGDTVTVNYGPEAAAVSSFNLTDSNPVLTGGTSAAGTGNSSNDVTLTATFAAGSLDTVQVERATVTGGVIGSYAALGTITPTAAQLAAGSATYADNDLAAGTYSYRFTPVNDGDTGTQVVAGNLTVTTPAADTTAPLAIDSILTTSAGFTGDFDGGDVAKVVFNEPLAAVAAGDTLRLIDNNGTATVADVVNGTNATFTLNTAAETVNRVSRPIGTVLTVTLTGAPTVVSAGSIAGLQLPVTIVDQQGTTDVAGNAWSVGAGSQDVEIGAIGSDTANSSIDTTAPTFTTTAPAAGATSVFFTASEPLDPATVGTNDFSGSGTVTAVSVSSDGLTITATVNALVSGNTVILANSGVRDANGNAGTGTTTATTP